MPMFSGNHDLSLGRRLVSIPGLVFFLWILTSVALTGCQNSPVREEAEVKVKRESIKAKQGNREHQLASYWRGRTLDELKAVFGEPEMTMSIPRYGWPASYAAFYGVPDAETGCIDSFLIIDGEQPWVQNYFCR